MTGDKLSIPPLLKYSYLSKAASTPQEAAFHHGVSAADAQNNANNALAGGTATPPVVGGELVVPQASGVGVLAVGPNDGNSAAVAAAKHLVGSQANSQYDSLVDENALAPPSKGGAKKRRTRKSLTKKKQEQKRVTKRRGRKSLTKKKQKQTRVTKRRVTKRRVTKRRARKSLKKGGRRA
jgi:hypothetical protein